MRLPGRDDPPAPPQAAPEAAAAEQARQEAAAEQARQEAAAAAPPAEEPAPAPAAAPQFGGATPSDQVTAATKSAAEDPGFVVAKPLLTTGAWGHDVAVLAQLLAKAGHPNAVAAGIEPPMLTDELMRTVRAFQEANGIDPTKTQPGIEGAQGADPNGPVGPPLVRKDHEGIVEWRTWAALYDAAGDDVGDVLEVATIRYPAGSFA